MTFPFCLIVEWGPAGSTGVRKFRQPVDFRYCARQGNREGPHVAAFIFLLSGTIKLFAFPAGMPLAPRDSPGSGVGGSIDEY
ncbi:MAG: hypothetical protein ABIP65_03155 [Vicinamibacterales bacterium]